MKKFLMALLLVLCIAFPAAAKTWTTDASTTSKDLMDAVVASTDVDTIIIGASISFDAIKQGGKDDKLCGLYISSDRTLTLQISKGCTLTVNSFSGDTFRGIYNKGKLTIKGEGSLIANNNSGDSTTHGVYTAKDATTDINGDVSISANGNGTTNGVWTANDATVVNIDGGVSISANGSGDRTCGVCANSKTNILSADISATGSSSDNTYSLYSAGQNNITVYAGKFSGKFSSKGGERYG